MSHMAESEREVLIVDGKGRVLVWPDGKTLVVTRVQTPLAKKENDNGYR
jgi:predicted lipoprotein